MKRYIAGGVAVSLGALMAVALTPSRSVGDTDASPRACVDCHKADKKLSTKLAALAVKVEGPLADQTKAAAPARLKLKGKHPKMAFGKAIPKSCLMCHAKTSKTAPPFAQLMHLVHRTGAQKIDCAACHKLNEATGAMSIPSADEP